MVTYYCPNCWTILDEKDQVCPKCGYIIKDYQDLSYEDKLLNALHHPVPERRIIAAQVLGILKSQRALIEFLKILESEEEDYFILRSILLAAANINHPNRIILLQKASRHPSALVRRLADELLAQISSGQAERDPD
jgi:HEAT repeat protein